MSMLANITRGKVIKPALLLIYGPGGIGKTTFASRAPASIFLGAEDGTDNIDVTRFPTPESFEDVKLAIKELIESDHNFETLVIDSLDWIEPLIHESICREQKVKSIERASGGYGKGYLEAANEWLKLKKSLDVLRSKKKMNIILIAHPETVSFTNPQTQTQFQRYELKLHKRPKAMFMEYVDAMFFASFEMFTTDKGGDIVAFATENRVLYTSWQTGFDAKNRYGLSDSLPLGISWDEFTSKCNIKNEPTINLEEIMFSIDKHIVAIKNEELKDKVIAAVASAQGDVKKLIEILKRLETIAQQGV